MEMRHWVRKHTFKYSYGERVVPPCGGLKGSVLVVEPSGKRAHAPAGRC